MRHGAWVKQTYGVEMVLRMLSSGTALCMYHKTEFVMFWKFSWTASGFLV